MPLEGDRENKYVRGNINYFANLFTGVRIDIK